MENPTRTWQDVARELAHETKRNRVTELAEELNQAMAAQMVGKTVDGWERGVPLPGRCPAT